MINDGKRKFEDIKLIGLALPSKTTNKNGKSSIDCGNLWQRFENEGYFSKIPNKVGNEIYAVYHNYEGDHTDPFSYFIGCQVKNENEIPDDLDLLTIPEGSYQKVIAKGKMPDCISDTWQAIWKSDIPRTYRADFEVYDERSQDWSDAEVDIFVSVE